MISDPERMKLFVIDTRAVAHTRLNIILFSQDVMISQMESGQDIHFPEEMNILINNVLTNPDFD